MCILIHLNEFFFAFLGVMLTGLDIEEYPCLVSYRYLYAKHHASKLRQTTSPSSLSNNLASAAKLEFLCIRVYSLINVWVFQFLIGFIRGIVDKIL